MAIPQGRNKEALLAGALATVLLVLAAWGQQTLTDVCDLDKETGKGAFKKPYSPYAGRNYPTRPLFGAALLHTSFSFDTGAFDCRLGPRDTYCFAFAKWEELTASMDERVQRGGSFLCCVGTASTTARAPARATPPDRHVPR